MNRLRVWVGVFLMQKVWGIKCKHRKETSEIQGLIFDALCTWLWEAHVGGLYF